MTIRILSIRKLVSRFRQRVEVLFSALPILRAKTCRILFVFSLADPFSALSAFQVSTHRSSSFLIPIRKEPNTVTDYNTTLPFSQGTPRFSLRFLSQIAIFPRIYCSNSTLLTSFRVPNATKRTAIRHFQQGVDFVDANIAVFRRFANRQCHFALNRDVLNPITVF